MVTGATIRTSYVSRLGNFGLGDGRDGPVELPERVDGERGVRLELGEACAPISRRPFWADYQIHRAVLQIPGRRPRRVAVEVDLAPWSAGRTEVGLRLVRPLRHLRSRRYFEAATRALDALVGQLQATVPAP